MEAQETAATANQNEKGDASKGAKDVADNPVATGGAAISERSNNYTSAAQRSNRSRKGNVKSQASKARAQVNSAANRSAESGNEYNKQGNANNPSASVVTARKNSRSLRGASQSTTKRKSDFNVSASGTEAQKYSSNQRKGSTVAAGGINVEPFEENKQYGTSSMSNTLAATGKKDSNQTWTKQATGVNKKKKAKKTDNNQSSATNSMHGTRDNVMSKNSTKNKKLMMSTTNAPSETPGVGESVIPDRATQKMKSTSSVSGRNIVKSDYPQSDRVTPPEDKQSSILSMNETRGRFKSKGPSGNNPSAGLDQIMKSTMKSGASGKHDATRTISNWDQSQMSETSKMMSQTGVLKTDPSAMVTKFINQVDEQSIDPRRSSQINLVGELSETSAAAAKQPASPASKAPQLRLEAERSRPPMLELPNNDRQSSIAELEDENPSPISAGPVLSSPWQDQKATTFGIKLQKLEVSSNMSVTKANELGSSSTVKQKAIGDSVAQSAAKGEDSLSPSRSPFIEPTSFSGPGAVLESAGKEEEKNDGDQSLVRPDLSEPLPILPKVTTVIHLPVKCPIENVRFVNLKRFLQFQKQQAELMAAGFDLVGQRRKMIQLKTEDKIKKGGNGVDGADQLAKIDDTTHFIKSIVYARDPKIIDQEKQHVHQRDAFSHLNNLDVKVLVAKNQLINDEGKYPSLSPRAVRRPQRDATARPILDSQIHKLKGPDDMTLLFESRFESGNLYLAQKVSDQEYNLLMQNDINTQGHTQWFFFQVKNTRAKQRVRFNILNYSKPDSLFNYGMKISVYSEKKSEKKSVGWHKDGEDIRYFMNNIRKDVTYYSKSYYTATFTYTFEYDDDAVFFAYSVPYTYTDLRNDLAAIETDPNRAKLVRKATLCRTLSGEQCEVLTITSADNLENFRQRKGVVITARVHPGETVGSWMMRGVLTFLTDPDNKEAKMLRENFVFKVVPMLNPDGVINGNYRCSLAGCDLNRRWKTPSKTLHPTIYHCKRLVKSIHQERGLVLFCDLHGHSRKQNVFMYGCNNKNNPGECRIFPYILSKMNPYFCYDYSRFGVQKSKESTARVALYKELKNVPNIYTMESTFAGLDMGPSAGKHLTTEMLETLGHDSCRAILIYCNIHVPADLADQPFFKNILLKQQQEKDAAANKKKGASDLDKKKFKEPALNIRDALMGEINNNAELLNNQGGDDSSSGSDSAPSEDNLQAEELIKQLPTADKTLKQQLKKNQEKKKKEEDQNAQSQVKLRRQSSGRNLKKEEPRRQMSPLKRPVQQPEKKEEKPEEKKKPKVETRDACTQTDRSDYQLIKQKMLKERKLKEEQAAAAAQMAQRNANQGISTERQLINDLNGRPSDYIAKQGMVVGSSGNTGGANQFNTTQRLQQMVAIQDNKSRSAANKMPLSQHLSSNPMGKVGVTNATPQNHPFIKNGQATNGSKNYNIGQRTVENMSSNPVGQGLTAGANNPSSQLPHHTNSGANQKFMIPDKNKYNFMGVSTIKQNSGASAYAGSHSLSNQPTSGSQNHPQSSVLSYHTNTTAHQSQSQHSAAIRSQNFDNIMSQRNTKDKLPGKMLQGTSGGGTSVTTPGPSAGSKTQSGAPTQGLVGANNSAQLQAIHNNQQMRTSLNAQITTPQSKSGSWQGQPAGSATGMGQAKNHLNGQVDHSPVAGHQYRAMGASGIGGSSLPSTTINQNGSQLDLSNQPASETHSTNNNSSKLPALNVRGHAQKSGRQDSRLYQNPNGTNTHQNASGVIGGLNIVMNSGQGTLQTPSQKKQYQISTHQKYQTQVVQPQLIGTSMFVVGGNNSGKNGSSIGPSTAKGPANALKPTQSGVTPGQSQGATNQLNSKQPVAGSANVKRQNLQPWESQNHADANSGAASQIIQGAELTNTNATSSATHRRNARGAIFSTSSTGAAGGQLIVSATNGAVGQDSLPSQMPFAKKPHAGSRTPSQNEMHRSGKGPSVENDFLPATQSSILQASHHKANTLHMQHNMQHQSHHNHHQSPVNPNKNLNLGTMSLENGQLNDFVAAAAQSPTTGSRSKGPPLTDHSFKQKASGSMVSRLRNQSEIAETRNQPNNYGTYDARGAGGGHQRQGRFVGGTILSASNPPPAATSVSGGMGPQHNPMVGGGTVKQMLTPNVNYSKRSIISNVSQGGGSATGKVVGKRYSRH